MPRRRVWRVAERLFSTRPGSVPPPRPGRILGPILGQLAAYEGDGPLGRSIQSTTAPWTPRPRKWRMVIRKWRSVCGALP
jgi:hypothetical protein